MWAPVELVVNEWVCAPAGRMPPAAAAPQPDPVVAIAVLHDLMVAVEDDNAGFGRRIGTLRERMRRECQK